MNSRNAVPSPTITMSVVPVAAGCCSTRARAMFFSSEMQVCPLRDGRNPRCGHFRRRFQFRFDFADQFSKTFFKCFPVAIGQTSHPEGKFAIRFVDWNYPDTRMCHIKDEG